jgi:hypothetical protein
MNNDQTRSVPMGEDQLNYEKRIDFVSIHGKIFLLFSPYQ